jgi:hypothetical protein
MLAGPHKIYQVLEGDGEYHWLHEGISHQCVFLFKIAGEATLRPFKTRCGIAVTDRPDAANSMYYNLVPVQATCLYCVSGKKRIDGEQV